MDILIIEDEPLAAERLERLVRELVRDVTIVGTIDSVKRAVEWFTNHTAPDVVLLDIQLADGISFRIFEECEINAPVIFTTAFEEYAIKAFKVNGIDYLLKPIDKEELNVALKKALAGAATDKEQLLQKMSDVVKMLTRKYKTRFVTKVGEHLRTVEVSRIRFFHSMEKTTFCATDDNRNLIIDFTLEELEDMLRPDQFFRINRKYLVSADAIQDIISYSNSRLRLVLKGSQDSDIIVARERVQPFRKWLDQ